MVLPLLIMGGLAASATSAVSQTPLNAEPPQPTGIRYIENQQVVQTPLDDGDQVTEPDIDVVLAEDTVQAEALNALPESTEDISIGLPLNAAERKRAAKARALAAQMSANMMQYQQTSVSPEAVINDTALSTDQAEFLRKLIDQYGDQQAALLPPEVSLHQFQNAWPTREGRNGVYTVQVCADCVYPVNTRELMISSITLPRIEKIAHVDMGSRQFMHKVRNDFTVAVQPTVTNIDTNMNVYTESGNVYAFYLRSFPFNSDTLPDVKVIIEDNGLVESRFAVKTMFDVQKVIEEEAPPQIQISGVLENLRSDNESDEDFIRNIEFDPGKLHGFDDYRVFGSADKALMPDVIFRDDQFTYIQWKDWDGTRLPSAYAVVDGLDNLVNKRVRGKTFIIESTADLISLKLGESYLCLQWRGQA